MNPDPIFNKKKILICSGSGGVGKTTLSAAIALEAAVRGKKAIVLTIDPAKRLATAMGLDSLENRETDGFSAGLNFRHLENFGNISRSGLLTLL